VKASKFTDKLRQYPLVVFCAVVIIISGAVIFLRGGLASELALKEADLTSRIRTIDQNVENSENLERDTEELAAVVEQMNSLLFNRYERAVNVSFFYEFEDKADVVISDMSQLPQPDPIYSEEGPRELELHSTLVFDIALGGSFSDVLTFLYEIDRAEPIIRVADFDVSRSERELAGDNTIGRMRLIVMAESE
jgi:hypothetical protein